MKNLFLSQFRTLVAALSAGMLLASCSRREQDHPALLTLERRLSSLVLRVALTTFPRMSQESVSLSRHWEMGLLKLLISKKANVPRRSKG